MIKKIFQKIYIATLVAFPSVIFAGDISGSNSSATLKNPLDNGNGNMTFTDLLTMILKIVTEIGSIVVVFFIIYAGFMFVTAQGNEEKLTKAKNSLMWTLIGAAILLGANAIALAVQGTVTSLQ
ncbi:MAG: TrbC/VirB2 family protein [bacterium]